MELCLNCVYFRDEPDDEESSTPGTHTTNKTHSDRGVPGRCVTFIRRHPYIFTHTHTLPTHAHCAANQFSSVFPVLPLCSEPTLTRRVLTTTEATRFVVTRRTRYALLLGMIRWCWSGMGCCLHEPSPRCVNNIPTYKHRSHRTAFALIDI